MKKIFALMLAILMIATFVGCGAAPADEYKLGMGIVVSLDSSADANEEKDAKAEANVTVATVITDKDGKIVSADLDSVQTVINVADGEMIDLDKVDLRSKKEKKEDYGMKGASPIGKEWYEQADAFCDKMVGKKLADVEAIALNEKGAPTDADLAAGCTIGVKDFKAAFIAALKDNQAKNFKAAKGFKLGLAVTTSVEGSKNATEEKDATASLASSFSAVAVDADGKVLAAIVDAVEPKVVIDGDGKIVSKDFAGTKRVLKEGYGMKGVSGIGKEWYEQASAFCDKMVGKTDGEVKKVSLDSDADLKAVCTMGISAFVADTADAIAAAK